jgi:MFS family permease
VFTNMIVAGVGSGALVAALPSAAAAAAPRGQTGVATAMTNTTKTIGGSFASSVFAVLLIGGATQVAGSTASSLFGYLAVFGVCGAGALVAAVLLFLIPRFAFGDDSVAVDDETLPALPL